MSTIKVNYDALQKTASDLTDESRRIFKLALEMERIMTKIPMKCTSQSLAKLKMARQCIGVTTASAKLMRFGVMLEEIGNLYKDADHRILIGGDTLSYAKHLIENAQGELSEDDLRRLRKAMEEIDDVSIHGGMTKEELDKIKLYNEMFEKAYPQEAERINNLAGGDNNNHYSENEILAKYLLYKNSLTSDKYNDDDIKNIFSYADEFPASFYARCCEALESDKKMGTANSVDVVNENLHKGNGRNHTQGNAHIYNFESHKNSDGSADVSFTISNKSKTYTEVTVYNANGEPIERIYMKGQRDSSSIPEVVIGTGQGIKDMFTGKFGHVDGDFDNAKQDFNIKIPAGGYIQITDDPDAMNYSTYVEQKSTDDMATNAGIIADSFVFESDNATVGVGFDVAKSAISRGASDEVKGELSSPVDYVVDGIYSGIESFVSSGAGNPASIGFAGINATLKINSIAEEYLVDVQQNRCKGNQSFFIYN